MRKTKRHNRNINVNGDVVRLTMSGNLGLDCDPLKEFPKYFEQMFRSETDDEIYCDIPLGTIPYNKWESANFYADEHMSVETVLSDDLVQAQYVALELIKLFYPNTTYSDLLRFAVWTHRPEIVARDGDEYGKEFEWVPQVRSMISYPTSCMPYFSQFKFREYNSYYYEKARGEMDVKKGDAIAPFSSSVKSKQLIDSLEEMGWNVSFKVTNVAARSDKYVKLVLRRAKSNGKSTDTSTINQEEVNNNEVNN